MAAKWDKYESAIVKYNLARIESLCGCGTSRINGAGRCGNPCRIETVSNRHTHQPACDKPQRVDMRDSALYANAADPASDGNPDRGCRHMNFHSEIFFI